MVYEVKVKRGFPSDRFQRDGLVFSKEPRILTDEELTEAIKAEPALEIKKLKAEPATTKKKGK